MYDNDQDEGQRLVFWVVGAVVTLLIALLLWWKLFAHPHAIARPELAVAAPQVTETPATPEAITPPVGDLQPKFLGELNMGFSDGKLTLTGNVPTERKKERLLLQAGLVFGAANIVDQISVAENAPVLNWKGKTVDLMAKLATLGNFQLGLKDNQINLQGKVSDDGNKAAWIDWLGNFFVDQPLQVNAENFAVDSSLPVVNSFDLSTLFNMRVNFASGSSDIPEADKAGLDTVAQFLVDDAGMLRIVGHTDSTGDSDSNRALSEARATAVKMYLVEKGVQMNLLSSYGMGQDQPIADNDTDAGRAQNRRIEFAR
jgi:OmpA-OmpF porin, OOP family